MKRIALSLIIALPLMFVGCSKENNTTGNDTNPTGNQQTVSSEFSFNQLNTWLYMSKSEVVSQLTAADFTEGMPYRKNETYTRTNITTGEMLICNMRADSTGGINAISLTRMTNGGSTATSIEFIKTYVGQLKELLKDEDMVQCQGEIQVNEYVHPSYPTWDEFVAGMEEYSDSTDLGLNWIEYHTERGGFVYCQATEYDNFTTNTEWIQLIKTSK